MKVAHITSGIISIFIGGFFYYLTLDFPETKSTDTGAAFMPRIYCGLLIVFGLILFIQGLLDKNKVERIDRTIGYALISMAIVLAYVLTMPYIGFYISTALTIFGLLLFSKVRKVSTLVSVPLGAILFVYIVFGILLKVSIPLGSLFS
ncbi:tripartite tricarboxylate transporter TctB family protein [Sporosarcina oncorhynchi]|uniref:Tripartite tricarboxylate transporter TctB family protein n=1 Tax=Sporosarcina oncorhynchi TaxID=3056444 RepID=A0ABZ0L7E9_9BACL|nr:tripartite tricarboxylate transporter TctB family protein [Sporosarcina sp. T2O-4]WOV88094.1 tripartite tricarboxylate transporter TctB family protein [Sporosarcina sp. T2O-4]